MKRKIFFNVILLKWNLSRKKLEKIVKLEIYLIENSSTRIVDNWLISTKIVTHSKRKK